MKADSAFRIMLQNLFIGETAISYTGIQAFFFFYRNPGYVEIHSDQPMVLFTTFLISLFSVLFFPQKGLGAIAVNFAVLPSIAYFIYQDLKRAENQVFYIASLPILAVFFIASSSGPIASILNVFFTMDLSLASIAAGGALILARLFRVIRLALRR